MRRRKIPLHWSFAITALVVALIDIVALPNVLAQNIEWQTVYYALAATSLALILAAFTEFRFLQMGKKLDKVLKAQRKNRRRRTF
jgi:hypothetical protein